MKNSFRLIVVVFFLFLSFFSTEVSVSAAEQHDFVTNDQLQSIIEGLKSEMQLATKEELQSMVQLQGSALTKEQITQELLNAQRLRISMLEGNFSALLSLLGVIVAVLTLFGGIFVWISRRAFSSKVEEVEKRLDEMKQLRNEVITKMETARELNSNLNMVVREAQELQINLNKSKSTFDKETKRINQLRKYVNFVELRASRSEIIFSFQKSVQESVELTSNLEVRLAGELPNYGFALVKVTEVLGGNVTKAGSDETIQEKIDYYIRLLKEHEESFWEEASIPLNWVSFVDSKSSDFTDPLDSRYKEWQYSFKLIKKVHDIIEAQISMNPSKFKHKH